ncbi:hypothetical protein VPH35_101582 [Triticum aestivum]
MTLLPPARLSARPPPRHEPRRLRPQFLAPRVGRKVIARASPPARTAASRYLLLSLFFLLPSPARLAPRFVSPPRQVYRPFPSLPSLARPPARDPHTGGSLRRGSPANAAADHDLSMNVLGGSEDGFSVSTPMHWMMRC